MGQNKINIPAGFKLAGIACGIAKKKGKLDVGLIYASAPCTAAAVFTTNTVKAAPVLVSVEHLGSGRIQAVIANSGNANACTGQQGVKDTLESAGQVAAGLGLEPHQVIVASTGVIGVPLPMEKMRQGIKQVISRIKRPTTNDERLTEFSQAIMTTDTVPKIASSAFKVNGKQIKIIGVAKGSGMIHPNMATMLAFIITDAAVAGNVLRSSLRESVNRSFNMLTVDGDTSTNDMALLLASGQAGNKKIKGGTEEKLFRLHLDKICLDLAKMMARDGEGATKFVEVAVSGAKTLASAKQVAMSIAKSSLVKTALFGNDPNWGRIIAAIGYSGEKIQPEKINISIAGGGQKILMCKSGRDPGFSETAAKKILKHTDLKILIDLGSGRASAVVFTCDLTHGYIDINASYRT